MRKLQPCGTRAAYVRHLYNNETPCEKCRAANLKHATAAPSGNSTNREVLKLEQAMAEDPPVIEWTGGLVKRGLVLHDPHADHHIEKLVTPDQRRKRRADLERQRRQRLKESPPALPDTCERGHELDAWNTIVAADGGYECRICSAHLENGPLMTAARADI